jgi:hypothetical protein
MSLVFFELHGDTTQKTVDFEVIAVRTSNPTKFDVFTAVVMKTQQTTWRHIPEDDTLNNLPFCLKKKKSRMNMVSSTNRTTPVHQ